MIQNNKDRVSLVVSKILRETQEGIIKWNISYNNDCSDVQNDDDIHIIGNIYIAEVENKNVRLFRLKERYALPDDSWTPQSVSTFITQKVPNYTWRTIFRLEFYNASTKRSEWMFPYTNAISDLYEVVCKQASGVDDFFSQYLNKK